MTLKPLILQASLLFTAAMGGAIAQNQEVELGRAAYKRLQKAKTAFDEMDYSTAIQNAIMCSTYSCRAGTVLKNHRRGVIPEYFPHRTIRKLVCVT